MAISGRQLSAARPCSALGISGSEAFSALRLSAAHRAAICTSGLRCSRRSARNGSTVSSAVLRCNSSWIDRLYNVGGIFPILAIAFGAHVLNCFGSWSSPTVRRINAFRRLCPLLRMPRSSSFSARKVSASSMINVGAHTTARNTVAEVTLEAASGRGTTAPRNVSAVVFPHSGVGLVMARGGEISKASWQ